MTNEEVRHLLINYLNEKGVKLSHVAKQAGISVAYLSKFKNGHVGLCEDTLRRLYAVIVGGVF